MRGMMMRGTAAIVALPIVLAACEAPTASIDDRGTQELEQWLTGTAPLVVPGGFVLAGSAGGATDLIVIGDPPSALNRFPFGGALIGWAGTRYQQAYAAAGFGTEPIRIQSVGFVGGQGALAASTYSVYLSTVPADIDGLSATDFDGNRGADNTLFASMWLEGPAPEVLTIPGLVPFDYDPSKGNLLVDIVIEPRATPPPLPAFYAYRTDAFGLFSRYQDFGSGSRGTGLVTQFELAPLPDEGASDPVGVTYEELMAAVQQAVVDGTLVGQRPGMSRGAAPASAHQRLLPAWLAILSGVRKPLENGAMGGACAQLKQAYRLADGEVPPPDFVTGPAVPELADMILALRTSIGCSD